MLLGPESFHPGEESLGGEAGGKGEQEKARERGAGEKKGIRLSRLKGKCGTGKLNRGCYLT